MSSRLRVASFSFALFGLAFACRSDNAAHEASGKPATDESAKPAVVAPLAVDSAREPVIAKKTEAPGASIAFGDSSLKKDLQPLFAGTTYDARVPHPDTILRQPLGTFTAHHAEILDVMRSMAAHSDRMRIVPFGRTHEGRELVSVVIATPENLAKIEAIRADIAKLADPRGVDAGEIDRIVKNSPAIAWLAYSIHGDEMSGSDASMAVAYHFAAGTSADVLDVLKNVVVVIDPCQNPDGRERILSMLEQGAGYVPNLDVASMSRGRWPYGRGNHYLFDMNRDWLWGTQPETRARWAAIRAWHPQLLVDAHEMGANDSFLFYPATDPFTPYFPQFTRTWWQRYSADQARAFDAHGWSYYTREWADSWYLGYTDAWATFQGACGILYEQARYVGQAIRRPSGEIVTYREAVQRQAIASVSNATTLSKNREGVLRDYVSAKQKNCAADTAGNDRMLVVVPGKNADREEKLFALLTGQGIEVQRADEEFTARNAETVLQGRKDARTIPKGAWIVNARQPLAPLVKAGLAFDPRYDQASLDRERKELERKQRSKSYDVTAWSPVLAYDLDAVWCDASNVSATRIESLPARTPGIVPLANASDPVYAWIVDGRDDGSVVFAARAMELGVQVNLGDEDFRANGRAFPRGSLLVRRHENEAGVADKVASAANAAGVLAYATGTARSADESADLGGQHFDLLARPRIAVMSNSPMDTDSFGHAWNWIDTELGLPCTLVDAQDFGGLDLRRYNVLVIGDTGGDFGTILKDNADTLKTWVRSGGTLIAMAGAAAAVCDKDLELTRVRQRSDVLDKLDAYAIAVKRERAAGKTPVDAKALFDEAKPADEPAKDGAKPEDTTAAKKDEKKDDKKEDKSKDDKEDAKKRDAWMRTFSPHGVFVRAEVNPDSWLAAGCAEEMPVFIDNSSAFLSELPVRTPVRLAALERVRLAGLLWPEARERLADTAYATVERSGSGQVILFASSPVFRGWFRATARLFSNAVVYGPGAGASQPSRW